MLRLTMPKEPRWIDLPFGVRVLARPLTTAVNEAARAKGFRLTQRVLQDHAEITRAGGTVEGLPDLEDQDAQVGLSQLLYAQAIACVTIIEWEGVEAKEGGPAPVSEETICDLMQFHSVAEVFVVEITKAHREAIEEGNASRPARNGTSAAGRNTAKAAQSTA